MQAKGFVCCAFQIQWWRLYADTWRACRAARPCRERHACGRPQRGPRCARRGRGLKCGGLAGGSPGGEPLAASAACFLQAWLDTVELAAEFAGPVPTLQGIPGFMVPGARRAWAFALRALCTDDGPRRCALGRFSCCCPGCCSHAAPLGARKSCASRTPTPAAGALQLGARSSELPTSAQLRARACAQVWQGDLSRARRTLTSASLAAGDEATLAALSGPDRRPPQPRRPLPPPRSAGALDAAAVADALRTAKKGTAAGLSGATVNHYKFRNPAGR